MEAAKECVRTHSNWKVPESNTTNNNYTRTNHIQLAGANRDVLQTFDFQKCFGFPIGKKSYVYVQEQ